MNCKTIMRPKGFQEPYTRITLRSEPKRNFGSKTAPYCFIQLLDLRNYLNRGISLVVYMLRPVQSQGPYFMISQNHPRIAQSLKVYSKVIFVTHIKQVIEGKLYCAHFQDLSNELFPTVERDHLDHSRKLVYLLSHSMYPFKHIGFSMFIFCSVHVILTSKSRMSNFIMELH